MNSLHALGRHEEEWELTHRLRRDHPEERVYTFYEAMGFAALAAGLSHVQIRTGYESADLRGHPGFDPLVTAPTF